MSQSDAATATTDTAGATVDPKPWGLAGRLTLWTPRRYFGFGALWALRAVVPLASGLALKEAFDTVSAPAGSASRGLWYVAAFFVAEALREVLVAVAIVGWAYWWEGSNTIVRGNVLRSVLSAPGPAATRVPYSPGEAVGRLRDDSRDLVNLADGWVDLSGEIVFAVVAVAVMAAVDPVMTAVVILPFVAGVAVTALLGDAVRRAHRAARQAAAEVTALVGDLFSGVLALKAAGAGPAARRRLTERNAARRQTAVRSQTLASALSGFSATTVELSIGLVLLLAAPAMRRGEFGVGDLALFTSYLGWLSGLPRQLSRLVISSRRSSVAAGRLSRLLAPGEDPAALVVRRPVWFDAARPPSATSPIGTTTPFEPIEPLELFTAQGLTARAPGAPRGIEDVDLRLARGTFTVVTGPVGAGKTTLLRAVLGLVQTESGAIRWNGRTVTDPGSFMVPPRAAYVAQVARLQSDTLAENLLLGWPDADDSLRRALHLAALERDVAAMPAGLATLVGPRGVRLSGGQLQRATTARALVRRPELLVVDDLSSALDVDTEAELWARLATGGPATCLVVSHRRAALLRADEVIVLADGRVADRGPLKALLERSPEMRRLWREEASRLAEGELTG
jgi:ATP-binding cassette subfamily B protein